MASAPFTYDHQTGGGAYDERTIGKDKDVVESLEGGDFSCGDHVSYLLSMPIAIVGGVLFGALTDIIVLRRFKHTSRLIVTTCQATRQ